MSTLRRGPSDVALAPIFVLIGTMFVDMIGFGIVLPLLPYYAVRFGASDWLVGPLVAAFSVAQLIAAPIWGKISDRYGRRPIVLLGLTASALSYVLFGLATSVIVLFLSRIVQGLSGGTVSVAQAYVADSSAPERRAQVLGWLSAATGAGFMIGPAIGSWAWHLGHQAPGFVAAALCLTNLLLAVRFLPEPAVEGGVLEVPPLRRVVREALQEPLARMIIIYFLGLGAFTSVTAVFPLYLKARFGIDESTVGYVFVYTGAVSVIIRGFAVGPLVRRFNEPIISRSGATVLAAGLGLGALAHSYLLLGLTLTLIASGTGLLFPPMAGLISRVAAPDVQGSTLGVNQFFSGIARVVGPLAGAGIYDAVSSGAPFVMGCAGVALAFMLALGVRPAERRRAVDTASD